MRSAGLLWREYRFERRLFWRNPSAAFFSFLLPLVLLFLVASIFARDRAELDVLVPGIAGLAVLGATFTALAYNVTFLREQGILKRVRGTPLPASAYVGGLLASAVQNAIAQVALIVAIGHVVYGLPWPRDPLALVAFTALGVICFAALGIAFSHAIPNSDSAAAYVNAVFLPTILISGVFFSARSLPPVLEGVAQALPLKHVIDGLAGAILTTDGFAGNTSALVVVALWSAAGLVLAVRYFRWE